MNAEIITTASKQHIVLPAMILAVCVSGMAANGTPIVDEKEAQKAVEKAKKTGFFVPTFKLETLLVHSVQTCSSLQRECVC